MPLAVPDPGRRRSGGFTFLELVASFAIISLISTLGVFMWRQHQVRVGDAAARHNLQTLALDEQVRYQGRGSFVTDVAGLATFSPGFTYTTGASSSASQISVAATTSATYGTAVALAARGSSLCFGLLVVDPDLSAPLSASWSGTCSATEAAARAGTGQW
jgi:type II secretory pathway pseudopilin PulG